MRTDRPSGDLEVVDLPGQVAQLAKAEVSRIEIGRLIGEPRPNSAERCPTIISLPLLEDAWNNGSRGYRRR